MAWGAAAPYVIPAAAGLLGGIGGKGAGNAANRPSTTTQRTIPYGGNYGNLDFMMNEAQGIYGQGNPQTDAAFSAYNDYVNQLYDREQARYGAQGPTTPPRFGGGGGGFSPDQWASTLGGIQAQPNEWLQGLLSGQYLDEGNPFLDKLMESIRTENLETYREGVLPAIGAGASGAGIVGLGGHSGVSTAYGKAFDEMMEATSQAQAGVGADYYNQERNRMLQGLGYLSNETMGLRGNVTGLGQSDIARQAQLGAARIAAQNSQYQFDEQMGFNREQTLLSNLQNRLGAATGYESLDWANLGSLQDILMPILQGFGTTTGTQQGPQMNPWGSAGMGALGGLTSGLGLYGMFSGMGGGGINPGFGTDPSIGYGGPFG